MLLSVIMPHGKITMDSRFRGNDGRKGRSFLLIFKRSEPPQYEAYNATSGSLHHRRELRPLRNRTLGIEFRRNVGAADQVHVDVRGFQRIVQITA